MAYVDTLSDLEDFGDDSKPWADFIFDLVDIQTRKSVLGSRLQSIAFEMRGAHETGDVGIHVSLEPSSWTVGSNDGFLVTYGNVTLRSAGANSDRLARLYEAWWELPASSAPLTNGVTLTAAGINCHPQDALSGEIHLKLFFEASRTWQLEDEDDPIYAELFLNFDLKARRGWLKEKDEGYRKQVVDWLTGQLHAGSL
jgi:hypothetical protein